MHLHFVQLVVFYNVMIFSKVSGSDYFLDEAQGTCEKKSDFVSCAKYEVLRYVAKHSHLPDYNLTSDSSWKIANFPNPKYEQHLLLQSRAVESEGEFMKIMKFLTRQAGRFLNTKGLEIELPRDAKVIETSGGRGKKKKKGVLLPFLSFLKLIKIDLGIGLILTAVIIIKKILIVAAVLIPGWLIAIKAQCKKAAASTVHVVPYQIDEEENHHDHHHEHDSESEFEPPSTEKEKSWSWLKSNRRLYIGGNRLNFGHHR